MRIFSKLLLATLLPALLVLGLVSGLTYLNLQRGFIGYVTDLESKRLDPAVARLAAIYAQDGNFDRLRGDSARWGAILSRQGEHGVDAPRPPPPPGPERPPPPRPSTDPLELTHRVTLYDRHQHALIGGGSFETDVIHKPIEVEGVKVAMLGVRPIQRIEDQLDIDYLASQRRTLGLIAALALALGTIAALLLSRSLAATIRTLAHGARRLACGDYEGRLAVRSKDELGALARDFNALTDALQAAQSARRRWVADTSHELRTPITVIQGEIEAMQDGIRTLDRESLASLHAEISQLNRLIDDLSLLANADRGELAYEMSPLDLGELVSATLDHHRLALQSAGLRVELDRDPGAVTLIRGEALRLTQLLTNVFENSRRYTDAPGRVRVRVWAESSDVRVVVEDSAPSVPADALPRLFERFFRPDDARSRVEGGSGLGLSICARITEAHDAELWAEPSTLGGLAVHLRVPTLS